MRHHDPFAEIEKVPLFAPDNMKSRGYAVRIEDEEADCGWREVGLVSQDYLLVPNRQVRDMALEIADRTGHAWRERKAFFDGKRFVYGLVSEDAARAEVKVGDAVSIGMLFENSYDGSRKLAVSLFVNRLACSNGMLLPQYFSRMRFKHDSSSLGWEGEVERALSVLDHAPENLERFAQAGRVLADMRLGSTELRHIRRDVLGRLPTTLWGKVMDRYLLDEELTGWGLLNAGTNICWHNEKGTIQDFNHNEHLTSGLIEFAAQELPAFRLN